MVRRDSGARATFGFSVRVSLAPSLSAFSATAIVHEPAIARWRADVVSTTRRSAEAAAYVVDDIGLPTNNPWRRGVRPGDIQFLRDGTGLLVTVDGDVWTARGLNDSSGMVHWHRFASGLHEPMTLAIRVEEIFVFDKNGIWRLRDTNHDGEADLYEMFSNAFAQTADMREFPSTIRLAPVAISSSQRAASRRRPSANTTAASCAFPPRGNKQPF